MSQAKVKKCIYEQAREQYLDISIKTQVKFRLVNELGNN